MRSSEYLIDRTAFTSLGGFATLPIMVGRTPDKKICFASVKDRYIKEYFDVTSIYVTPDLVNIFVIAAGFHRKIFWCLSTEAARDTHVFALYGTQHPRNRQIFRRHPGQIRATRISRPGVASTSAPPFRPVSPVPLPAVRPLSQSAHDAFSLTSAPCRMATSDDENFSYFYPVDILREFLTDGIDFPDNFLVFLVRILAVYKLNGEEHEAVRGNQRHMRSCFSRAPSFASSGIGYLFLYLCGPCTG
jgi:hypothetical protein